MLYLQYTTQVDQWAESIGRHIPLEGNRDTRDAHRPFVNRYYNLQDAHTAYMQTNSAKIERNKQCHTVR